MATIGILFIAERCGASKLPELLTAYSSAMANYIVFSEASVAVLQTTGTLLQKQFVHRPDYKDKAMMLI